MTSQFKVVGVFGRVKTPGVIETLTALVAYLRELKQTFLVDAQTAESLADTTLPLVSRTELSKQCQLLIVVGGDGSLLQAAHIAVDEEIPVVGINRGRLGFLTDILPSELPKIKSILEGQFHLEKRFLLSCMVEHNQRILGQHMALNEVALIPDCTPHMNQFEIYIDDQFLCSQDSDGLIAATPTGSTAYALSGGGPILHPRLDAIVIVPMFPHTLSIRPIVLQGNSRITIIISSHNTATPRVTCDGQSVIDAPGGSQIHLQKKSQRLHLAHPLDYDYYATLRSKLHWGRKLHHLE